MQFITPPKALLSIDLELQVDSTLVIIDSPR